jgi:hypothetical protein
MLSLITSKLGAAGVAFLVLLAALAWCYHDGSVTRGKSDAATYAAAQKKADDAWQAKLNAAQGKGAQLAAELAKEQANVKTVTVTLVKEIPKVTTIYKEKPGAPTQALPSAIYTWGFVRVWDDASDPTVKHDVSKSAGVAPGAAAEADLVRSSVDTAGVLANHIGNAGQYADCRSQLNALIDWHVQNPTEKSPQ